jgi:hypothetical protein
MSDTVNPKRCARGSSASDTEFVFAGREHRAERGAGHGGGIDDRGFLVAAGGVHLAFERESGV